MTKTKRSLTLTLAAAGAALCLSAVQAAAQTVSTDTPAVVASGKEWATTSMQDPIDMSQWTDISWWAYSVDAPIVDLSGVTYGSCTAAAGALPTAESLSSCFKATTVIDSTSQPNIWILETGNPVSADLHKNGDNFPIDANTYNTIALRMRLTSPGGVCPAIGAAPGPAAPVQACNTSFLWNKSNLYDGVAATQTNGIPTYDGWGIYFIDLATIGTAGPTPWAGTIRDLRYNLQAMSGANVEIDWIRLVPNNLTPQTITWSGFSTQVDIYLDNDNVASNGNLGLMIQNTVVSRYKGDVVVGGNNNGAPTGSGSMTFQPGALAPGNYDVEICPAGTSPTDSSCKYSAGSFKVNDIPTLTFTSPSPEGSSDDFATTVLGNAWDMNSTTDIDYFNNITGLTATTISAVDEAGNPINNGSPINVLQAAGSAVGDPYMYALWYNSTPVPGRGQTNKIDANKYHILTFEAGIPDKARDINGGSIARIVWQVQGERSLDGLQHPRENVSDDIVFNHRAGANVMAKVTLDMKTLKLESDPGASPSTTGWVGNIESFRFDPHEFTPSTPFYLRRLKLAANEQTTGTYTIQWNYTDPVYSSAPTMTLYYDTDTDPTSGRVQIATGLDPTSGSYAWNTVSQAVPNGTYYIYASFTDGQNSNAAYSRQPIIVGPLNGISATPPTLALAATKSGATLPFSSDAQDVTVSFSGTSAAWTATTSAPWAQITNGSGTGAGRFTVTGVNPGDVIGTSTSLAASIVVSAPTLGLSTILPVTLSVKAAGTSSSPFGAFDTPTGGSTALTGSFAVTGWALDDIGIDHVEIWRDPVAGETTPPYQGGGPGKGKIFIATPLFISGARPDIESAYGTYPFASRAGWGYLLLSWGLWNHGNGPYTLYAFAYDKEGHVVTLGTKTIVVDNAQATKPFGALDTPGYGATSSGSFWNFGWALTPNASPSCTIGASGVQVGIDSGALVSVSYGDLRPDIASGFPGFTNSGGAGGAYYINTTTLTNGTHQIGWYVVDDCGRADGIGSRFFTVLNGGSTVPAGGAATSAAEATTVSGVDWNPVRVQRHDQSWHWSYPNSEGTRVVGVGQGERIEVQLPPLENATYEGHHVVAGVRSALPLGSSLDARTGMFYWEPVAGFLGNFDIEFVATRSGEQRSTSLRVVVGPSMRTAIDAPQPGSVIHQPFVVAGWAIDLAASDGSGVDTVHVWAYPIDGREPVFLGVAAFGDTRTDVGAVYGKQFQDAAYNLTAVGLRPGTYDLVVYPHRSETNTFDGAQVVRVTVR